MKLIKIGDKPIFSIKAKQPMSHNCTIVECNIDPDLTENQHRQMQEITQKWAKTLIGSIQDRGPAKDY